LAKPQIEDGHTQIANELMDAFCHSFPGGANAQILMAIIRKTYGWKKKEDAISLSQLEELTRLSRRMIIYGLQNLEAMRMIRIKRERGRGNINLINTIALEKNYDLWVVQRNAPQYDNQLRKKRIKYQQGVVQRTRGSATNSKRVVQRNGKEGEFVAPTKETITKEIYTKEIYIQKYGEFNNVLLTEGDYKKLIDRFGEDGARERVEHLSEAISSKGYKYKSHYATILCWERRDQKAKAQDKNSLPNDKPIKGLTIK